MLCVVCCVILVRGEKDRDEINLRGNNLSSLNPKKPREHDDKTSHTLDLVSSLFWMQMDVSFWKENSFWVNSIYGFDFDENIK